METNIPHIDVDAYRRDGFVLAPRLFDSETIVRLRVEADAMLKRVAAAGRNVEATWQGGWRDRLISTAASVSSIHDVQYHSAHFMRVIMDERLTGAVAQLLGDDVQLHHTKYHLKPPALGAPFPLHQDYPYFPHAAHTMLAAAIHIDAADIDNGCFCLVPGSHRLGPLQHQTEGSHFLPPDEWPLDRATPCTANEGDVLFFNYLTVHGSYVNGSTRPRRLLLVQMRSPLDRPLTGQHLSPGQGTMLRGINPGGAVPTGTR